MIKRIAVVALLLAIFAGAYSRGSNTVSTVLFLNVVIFI